jgi:CRISPR/Cas system CSM-associated protein Csm3 (group 7 of RAMP superfamily)
MNPYQFVPLGPPAQRSPARTHESFGQSLQAGTLLCRLKTLTAFFIAASHERTESNEHPKLQFLREHGAPIIPGSSLKGVIRSVAEALSGSCLVLAGDSRRRTVKNDKLWYRDKNRDPDYSAPNGFSPCGLTEEDGHRYGRDRRKENEELLACPACRMFGYLSGRKVHLGYVNFSTARLLSEPQWQWLTLAHSGSPAPRHRPFYGIPETGFQAMRGRKFYYHHSQGARTTEEKNDQNKTVEALMPEAEFEFTIDYENLTEEELALLIFALELEESMRHKLGMGKGVGLGSVQINIQEWRQIDLSKRYQQFDGGKQSLNDDKLQPALQAQRDKFHQSFADWKEPLQKLHEIWTWDENDKRKLEYPTYSWFKDFRAITLEEVPDDAGQHKVRAASASPRPTARFEGRSAPSSPRPEDLKAAAEAQKEAQKLLRKIEKEKASSATERQTAYTNNATEPKATVAQAEDGAWQVILPKLPQHRFVLKTKQQFSKAIAGGRIRVRVVVDGKGNIVRAEEL